nr:reverse transcriptase domain-containing protein [Tanacetum cinerariifolium]
MEELLQAPTEGYGEAIVIPEVLAENFEIKTNLLQDNVSKTDDRIDKLADQILNLVEIVNKQVIAPAKAVEKTYVTCGGAHAYYDCIATDSNQPSVCAATGSYKQVSPPNRASHLIPPPGFAPNQPSTSGTLPSNNVPNPKGEMRAVTTRSGLAYEGPSIPTNSPLPKVDEQNIEDILDKEHSNSSGSTAQIQPPVVPISIPKLDAPRTQTKPTIPYPSRDGVVDFEADPRVPLIFRRLFLRTDRALIDVYGEDITLRYNPKSSSPTLVSDASISESDSYKEPIVKSSSPTLTTFGESDFFLEEIEYFLNDDSIPTGIKNYVYDPEGAEESKAKSIIEEPHELELKELPSHLEYAFLEDSNKLPVIIAKNLKDVERKALINVLKSHKQAIA